MVDKYATYKGQLKGKMVLLNWPRNLGLQAKPSSTRLSEGDLNAVYLAPEPRVPRQFDCSKMKIPEVPEERDQFFAQAPQQFWDIYRDKLNEVMEQLYAFLRGEGTVAILTMDTRGDGGTVFGESAGSWDAKYPLGPPSVA